MHAILQYSVHYVVKMSKSQKTTEIDWLCNHFQYGIKPKLEANEETSL